MRLLPSVGACVALLLSTVGATAQQTARHEFPDHGFSLEIPTRWATMPTTLTAAFDSAMATREPADARTVAGFQMVASPERLAPPYVMVRVQRVAALSREDLAAAAMSPSRLIGLNSWLAYVAETYGKSYDMRDFTWNDNDAIFWMASSGAEDPYPDLANVTGAVAFEGAFVVVAYRTFPSTDLKMVRDSIRQILLSLRPLGNSPSPARGPLGPQRQERSRRPIRS